MGSVTIANAAFMYSGIPESSESPKTSRAIARFGMDEFARRLQQKEQVTERKLQDTITRAEQLEKENAALRRVTRYVTLLLVIITARL